MEHIPFCLERQAAFSDVIRIPSMGQSVDALADEVRKALKR